MPVSSITPDALAAVILIADKRTVPLSERTVPLSVKRTVPLSVTKILNCSIKEGIIVFSVEENQISVFTNDKRRY